MPFRRTVTRLGELLADTITGALIRTAAAGSRMEIAAVPGEQFIRFYLSDDAGYNYGWIGASEVPFPNGRGSIILVAPATPTNPYRPLLGLFGGVNSADSYIDATDFGKLWVAAIHYPNNVTTKAVAFGDTGNVACNANGRINVSHGLQAVPGAVLWSDNGAASPFHGVHIGANDTALAFTIEFRKNSDNSLAPNGTVVSGDWYVVV